MPAFAFGYGVAAFPSGFVSALARQAEAPAHRAGAKAGGGGGS